VIQSYEKIPLPQEAAERTLPSLLLHQNLAHRQETQRSSKKLFNYNLYSHRKKNASLFSIFFGIVDVKLKNLDRLLVTLLAASVEVLRVRVVRAESFVLPAFRPPSPAHHSFPHV